MFLSLLRVGFSERQALFIISMAVVSMDVGDEGYEDEVTISPQYDHPSNRDGSSGEAERHPSTVEELEEDMEEFDEDDEGSSS